MPQLVRGGKWVFGWVIVEPRGERVIPPQAWDEYGFQVGNRVTFLPGSRKSGGFGLCHARLLARMPVPLQARVLARARVNERAQVVVPPAMGVQPGDRLLAVRGSGHALGFVSRGPIYGEAMQHAGLACFGVESRP